jgi:hypothetical protein
VFCGSGGLRYELVEIGVDGVLRERGLHFKNVRLQLLAYCGARWPGHSPVAVNGAASRMMPADVHDADEQIHASRIAVTRSPIRLVSMATGPLKREGEHRCQG